MSASSTQVSEERSTGRAPLTDQDVEQLLASSDTVLIARGRSIERIPVGDVRLGDLRGPTGRFRAPIIQSDRTLLVGFNLEALHDLL